MIDGLGREVGLGQYRLDTTEDAGEVIGDPGLEIAAGSSAANRGTEKSEVPEKLRSPRLDFIDITKR